MIYQFVFATFLLKISQNEEIRNLEICLPSNNPTFNKTEFSEIALQGFFASKVAFSLFSLMFFMGELLLNDFWQVGVGGRVINQMNGRGGDLSQLKLSLRFRSRLSRNSIKRPAPHILGIRCSLNRNPNHVKMLSCSNATHSSQK